MLDTRLLAPIIHTFGFYTDNCELQRAVDNFLMQLDEEFWDNYFFMDYKPSNHVSEGLRFYFSATLIFGKRVNDRKEKEEEKALKKKAAKKKYTPMQSNGHNYGNWR
jgi:hypothetical protein